jgi:hypothetical protein
MSHLRLRKHNPDTGEVLGRLVIAALYVQPGGAYFGVEGVDPWDEARDARTYPGPWPVVAHPPCERWGRYWGGGPMLVGTTRAKRLGDDGGCFASALAAVRRWGGVLEHPEASHAWSRHGLNAPPRHGGWVVADFVGGWTCCVEQGHYGHRAQKATWLYAVGVELPGLTWGSSFDRVRVGRYAIDPAWTEERKARARRTGILQRLSKKQREATPIEFRDLLLSIARTAYARRAA